MKHVIASFKPMPGFHCNTVSMKQIFHYYGHPVSEEMLLGLGAALHFVYFEFKFMPFPFVGGRTKIGDFEQSLTNNLGVKIEIHRTSSVKRAFSTMVDMIASDHPVMVFVDMPYLSYLGLPEEAHFGGHSIVVFGIDEGEGTAYVSDRDGPGYKITLNDTEEPVDFHKVPLTELEAARNSKCKTFPPKNGWVTFDFSEMRQIGKGVIYGAIKETVTKMTEPPIKNLGLKGIKTFAKRLPSWKDMGDETLWAAAFNTFIMINEVGGTGGGAFRRMYGNFLKESARICGVRELAGLGTEYIAVSEDWDELASGFKQLADTRDRDGLSRLGSGIERLFEKEIELISKLNTILEE